MPLPPAYLLALELLGQVFLAYEETSGHPAVLVGGAATAIYTDGAFMSGDFDIVVGADETFADLMKQFGFVKEDRLGFLHVGYYHPAHPEYGFQQVTGPLFDGRADQTRLHRFRVSITSTLELLAIEDLIADRLAQHAIASPSDVSRLDQAIRLVELADHLDVPYLARRVGEEGGDIALLQLPPQYPAP